MTKAANADGSTQKNANDMHDVDIYNSYFNLD
jgi:hypothetical protein